MKNTIFFLTISVIAICACSNKKNKQNTDTDPTRIVVPSNSDATNPSLADTAYREYDSVSKKDSTKKTR